ncbi:uncharacterized protein LOC108916634 isoform X2 [Anoplophora glabripennis]|nr:uncharacterized protein LOC108916634 isoform X2 [Anoplophora glabripennis]
MLKIVLQKNLPQINSTKVNIPWKLLKNIPKPDRKKFRNEYGNSDKLQINKLEREGLTFGINDVTKLLENNLVSVILVTSDVQPKFMVRHVLDTAILYRVPIIIFDDLRHLLFKVCGISSVIIGISKNINPESKLNLIKESVIQIFEKLPEPLDHINYNRSIKNVSNMETSQPSTQQVEDKDSSLLTNSDELIDGSTIYLIRKSKDKRVFIPDKSEYVNIHKMEVDSTGFLPFSEPSRIETDNKSIKTNYKSLIVKRLKGNPNRNKRKIENLKRKLK